MATVTEAPENSAERRAAKPVDTLGDECEVSSSFDGVLASCANGNKLDRFGNYRFEYNHDHGGSLTCTNRPSTSRPRDDVG